MNLRLKDNHNLTREQIETMQESFKRILDSFNTLLEISPQNFTLKHVSHLLTLKQEIDNMTFTLDLELKNNGVYKNLDIELKDDYYYLRHDYKLTIRQFKNICETAYKLGIGDKKNTTIYAPFEVQDLFIEYQKVYSYSNINVYEFKRIIKFVCENVLENFNSDYQEFFNHYRNQFSTTKG